MMDPELLERLYARWLDMVRRCLPWAGVDAEEALSEALAVPMKKPVREEQAGGVFRTCLRRVRSRRLRQQGQFVSIPDGYDQAEMVTCCGVDREEVQEAIAQLSAREQRVIRLRYFTERKKRTALATIGRQEGVSGERIRQLEQRALARLRTLLERD
jgi:RNA polymerase sigma factor (sigma-70 family)